MSNNSIIQVARAGVVIGKYSPPEFVALLESGQLRDSDHYWQEGMGGWAVLSEYIKRSSVDPVKSAKSARVRVRKITPSQEGYLHFLGAVIASGMSMDDASRAIDEIHSRGGYREGWSFQKHIISLPLRLPSR